GSDPHHDPLHFKVTSLPTSWKLYDGTGTGGHLFLVREPAYALIGSLNYSPYLSRAGYSGPDSFQFKANDGQVDSTAAATVSITEIGRASCRESMDDSAATPQYTAITVSALANDTDPDKDLMRDNGVSQPARAIATVT